MWLSELGRVEGIWIHGRSQPTNQRVHVHIHCVQGDVSLDLAWQGILQWQHFRIDVLLGFRGMGTFQSDISTCTLLISIALQLEGPPQHVAQRS